MTCATCQQKIVCICPDRLRWHLCYPANILRRATVPIEHTTIARILHYACNNRRFSDTGVEA